MYKQKAIIYQICVNLSEPYGPRLQQQPLLFNILHTRAGQIPNFFEYRPSKPLNGRPH